MWVHAIYLGDAPGKPEVDEQVWDRWGKKPNTWFAKDWLISDELRCKKMTKKYSEKDHWRNGDVTLENIYIVWKKAVKEKQDKKGETYRQQKV